MLSKQQNLDPELLSVKCSSLMKGLLKIRVYNLFYLDSFAFEELYYDGVFPSQPPGRAGLTYSESGVLTWP